MQKADPVKLLLVPVLVLLLGSWLLLGLQIPSDSRALYEVQQSGHAIALFCMMLALSLHIRKYLFPFSLVRTLAISGLICICFGAATELVQMKIGREASWSDFFTDIIGIAAGACGFLVLKSDRSQKIYWILACLILLLWSVRSPLAWFYAEKQRDLSFPIIGDFESRWTSRFFEGAYSAGYTVVPAPAEWQGNESLVAKIDIVPGSWPGIKAFDLQKDWSGYQTFNFDVFNPQQEKLELVLRIHDVAHKRKHDDRFNKTYTLPHGLEHISVAIDDIVNTRSGRKMRIEKIDVIMAYMNRPKGTYTLYFDNFRLE